MANTTYTDVLFTSHNPPTQKLGDILLADSSPSGQINVGSEFIGPIPANVVTKYDHRFDKTNYYYPGRG